MKNNIDFERVFELCRHQPRNVPLEEFTSPYAVLVSTVMAARTNDESDAVWQGYKLANGCVYQSVPEI